MLVNQLSNIYSWNTGKVLRHIMSEFNTKVSWVSCSISVYWYILSFSLCFVIFIPFRCQRWNTFKSATSLLLRCSACYVRLPAKCYCHICRIVKHTIWPFTTLALFLHFLKLEAKIEKTGERTKSVVFDARYLISLTAAGTWQNETTNENSCVSCGKYLGL